MVTKIHPNCIITEEVTQNHPKAEKLTLFELHSEMISFFGHVGKGIFFIGRLYKRTDGRPCFSSWVTEIPLIVKFFHVFHCLLWRNSKLLRYEFLCFNSIQWERSMLYPFLFINLCYFSLWIFLNLFKQD